MLVARLFAPDHEVNFIEWWEIALFADFWGLETRRVARLRDNKVEKPDPDRGPLKEPDRTTVDEQSSKAETVERQINIAAGGRRLTGALDARQRFGHVIHQSLRRVI